MMNNNLDNNIESEFLNHFNYSEKNNYHPWKPLSSTQDDKKRVYYGANKDNTNDFLHVKQIKSCLESYQKILKELYFLVILKKHKYFVELDDVILSSNKEFIFFLFKGNNISLDQLINSKETNYLSDKELVKSIIFKICSGLYFLHFNNIIHNDIKSSNILIGEDGEIYICDFGSATYRGETSLEYTLEYSSPEFLKDRFRNEKSDMWALGVIMTELFSSNINCKFSDKNEEKNDKNQLNLILSNFGITDSSQYENFNELIKNIDSNEKFIDNDGIDLINNLIVLNPDKRYSARQALESPYLKDCLNENPLNIEKIKSPINYNDLLGEIDESKFEKIFYILKEELKKSK